MLGIYKKKVADDEFLFIPKEPCPFVNAQGIVRCRSEAFFPDMSPVVVEGHMGDEGIYHIEKIAYPLSNKREASFFLNYLETKLPDSEKIKILNVMGNDIIPFVKRKDAEKILFEKIPEIPFNILSELVIKIRTMADTKNLVEFLKKKKIKKETIEKIIDSGLPYEQLRRNPFRTWYGIDPFSAEKIAENIEPYDSHRLAGFISYVIDSFISSGDTCVTFKDIKKRLYYLTRQSMYPDSDIPMAFIYNAIKKMNRYLTIDTINNETYVYKTRILQQEIKVAQHVIRLCENKTTVVHDIDIDSIEKENGFCYNEGQKAAFPAVKKSGVKIITGPPGSGKTAIIKGLIAAYKSENKKGIVELSATTGAAAQVIKKSCGENGQTVHKLLNLRPCGDTVLCKSEGDPIDAGLIIVDEVSMINMSQVDENNPSSKSELDLMFEQIDQTSLAAKYYKAFKQAAGKTLKSIIISCVVRLQSFMTPQVTRLTGSDNINLASIGDEKTILFIITPQADRTFAFLASMLYSQLFETLYHKGETQKLKTGSERLTYHVRCLMDEFANIGEIPEFPSKLSTMRKYNISATIVLQDNSQLQSMYKDEWRTIMANCDSTIFLGNAEPDTLKYFCEKLGNETVTAQSRGRSYGSKSGSSQNYQQVKRETLTAEEIGRLPNDECLVFLRGERPARDKKFKYETHKNYDLTGDAHSENNYAYDSMLIYDNQSLKGFSSIAAAKVASMEEDISEAKSAEDVFDIDPNYLLDNTYFSEVEEEQNFLLLSQECIMQIEMSSDDVQIIRFASERNIAPRILPDLVESVKVETGLEKLIIIANNGGKDTYCCGTENLCTIMDSEYVKEKKTMGNTIRTMVSTDNIDEYVEEIREVQAA